MTSPSDIPEEATEHSYVDEAISFLDLAEKDQSTLPFGDESITGSDAVQRATSALKSTLSTLQRIWHEIGIEPRVESDRTDTVVVHVENLLKQMVAEELKLKQRLLGNVAKFESECASLCEELELPVFTVSSEMTIVKKETALRKKRDALKEEKEDRMEQLKDLQEREQELCDMLCTTPYYIPSETVPSRDQLLQLKQTVKSHEILKAEREKILATTKKAIKQLLDDLELEAETSFEREVMMDEDEAFTLSAENMRLLRQLREDLETKSNANYALAKELRDRITTLWERISVPDVEREAFNRDNTGFKPSVLTSLKTEIERCELLKLENMQRVVEATREELKKWWEKCYIGPEERSKFSAYKDDNFTEELLEAHDKEVEKVKKFYQEHESMFEKVERWSQLWEQYQEFERKANDPMRFANRGCTLLKEENKRKKLNKELPKVEEEVKGQLEDYERQTGVPFLVNGVRFVDFIEQQWDLYRVQKELEKNQRVEKRKGDLLLASMYGSKPNTPRRNGGVATPGTTPKRRKLNDTTKTPGGTTRLGTSKLPFHSSTYQSPRTPRARGALNPVSQNRITRSRTNTADKDKKGAKGLAPPGGDKELFSQTTLSNGSTASTSLASLGHYSDFANGLNSNAQRSAVRSSVIPPKGKHAAYF